MIDRPFWLEQILSAMNPDRLNPAGLKAFREAYPKGSNWLVCPGISDPYDRSAGGRHPFRTPL